MYHYAWLVLSLIVLGVWVAFFVLLKNREERRETLLISFFTSLLGLTEPLFVPEYWNPPSLFNLAERVGFDLESFIFAFAVGGLAFILYNYFFSVRHSVLPAHTHRASRHRLHRLSLISAPAAFLLFYLFLPFNVIYSASLALLVGFFFAWYCRSDLVTKMIVSGLFFTILYFLAFLVLETLFPGYVEAVWNLPSLSGKFIAGVPIEELLWAFTFGLYWSSVYEHLTWRKIKI